MSGVGRVGLSLSVVRKTDYGAGCGGYFAVIRLTRGIPGMCCLLAAWWMLQHEG